jgi:hypothetical protein
MNVESHPYPPRNCEYRFSRAREVILTKPSSAGPSPKSNRRTAGRTAGCQVLRIRSSCASPLRSSASSSFQLPVSLGPRPITWRSSYMPSVNATMRSQTPAASRSQRMASSSAFRPWVSRNHAYRRPEWTRLE